MNKKMIFSTLFALIATATTLQLTAAGRGHTLNLPTIFSPVVIAARSSMPSPTTTSFPALPRDAHTPPSSPAGRGDRRIVPMAINSSTIFPTLSSSSSSSSLPSEIPSPTLAPTARELEFDSNAETINKAVERLIQCAAAFTQAHTDSITQLRTDHQSEYVISQIRENRPMSDLIMVHNSLRDVQAHLLPEKDDAGNIIPASLYSIVQQIQGISTDMQSPCLLHFVGKIREHKKTLKEAHARALALHQDLINPDSALVVYYMPQASLSTNSIKLQKLLAMQRGSADVLIANIKKASAEVAAELHGLLTVCEPQSF